VSVDVYTVGLVHASVCTDLDDPDEIAREVNAKHPTGISSAWKISDAPTFSGGQPNPCPCDRDPDRKHYLMVC
jgi:hypothetical protein